MKETTKKALRRHFESLFIYHIKHRQHTKDYEYTEACILFNDKIVPVMKAIEKIVHKLMGAK